MTGPRKLGKTTDQRKAMLRQQVTDFLDNGKMETTVTRCKEIAPLAEKMITLGRRLHQDYPHRHPPRRRGRDRRDRARIILQ